MKIDGHGETGNAGVDGGEPLDLAHQDVSGRDLRGAVIRNAPGARFDGADLTGADLRHADLMGAAFPGAILSGARFDGATLMFADLGEAAWEGASFREANLSSAEVPQDHRFLPHLAAAANVSGVDLSALSVGEGEAVDLRLLEELVEERGVVGIAGRICAGCLWQSHDLNATDSCCSACGGSGLLPEQKEVMAARQPLACPWCRCDGTTYGDWMGSTTWTCVVCKGLGRMGYDGLDKAAVVRDNEVDHSYLEEHSRWASSTVVDADLRHMAFARPDFSGHVFERCRFATGALAAGNLDGVRFIGCDLSNVDFRGCSLDCTEFIGCNLRGARWDEHRRGHVIFERCRHI